MYGAAPYGTTPYGAAPGPAAEPEPPPEGAFTITLPLRVTVAAATDIALPIEITVIAARDIVLPLRVTIASPIDITLPSIITLLSSTVTSPARWRPVVTLGGVDVSERVVGQIDVEAAEGEARIASFSMRAAAGTLLLPDWTGKPVEISIAKQEADGSASDVRRLFTGVVDVPSYDLATHVVQFDCTDQRQEVIGNTPREWIDTNVAGYYSDAVSGAPADTLGYALARLASVPASLDLDAWQSPRVTAWALPDPADLTFDESDILDGSLQLQLASRADLRNEITTGLQYRFPRLRARVITAQFERTIDDYTLQALDIPSRAMIEQALSGLGGWSPLGAISFVGIDPGAYESAGTGGSIFTVISITDAPNLALGFSASYYSRWVQSVTEDYSITVRAQASVDAIGYARESLDAATLDAPFDDAGWLDDPATEPELDLPSIGDVALDYATAGADRAAATAAIEALVAQAKTAALASHRTSRASAAVAIRPDIDLDRRIEIDTPVLVTAGKVSRVAHRMDLQEGSAVTEFDVAISGFNAVGLQDDDEPDAPAAPTDPTPAPGSAQLAAEIGLYIGQTTASAPYDQDVMIGFTTNAKAGADYDFSAPAYPLAMSIGAPEIEAAVRDPITLTAAATYAVAIPQDPLEVPVP
jgi:hypothetical protein